MSGPTGGPPGADAPGRASILRNFGLLVAGRALGELFLFAFLIFVTRAFGTGATGVYGIAVGIAGFASIVAGFGLLPYAIREANRDLGAALRGRVLTLQTLLATGVLALLGLGLRAGGVGEPLGAVILWVSVAYLLRRLAEGAGAFFIASERSELVSALSIAAKGLGAAFAVVAGAATGSLTAALAALALAEAVHWGAALALARRRLGPLRPEWRPRALSATARGAWPFASMELLGQLTSRSQVLLVGALAGTAAAGQYHAAARFLMVLLWIPHFAAVALLPRATRHHRASPGRLRDLYGRALGEMMLVAVPATVGLVWVAPELVALLFGAEFSPASDLLRWLAPLLLATCLSRVVGTFLIACQLERERTRHQLWAAAVGGLGSALAIPLFGPAGAACSAGIAQGVLALLGARALAPRLGPPCFRGRLSLALGATAGFAGVLLALPAMSLAGTVAIGVSVYGLGLLVSGEIREEAARRVSGWRRRLQRA